jgi:hypothetical protein
VGAAGLASTAWRRAGLGAAGFIWLATAELLGGEELLFGVPGDAEARSQWAESVPDALRDAIGPVLFSPAVLPVFAWAAFAAAVPLVVRGRSLPLDVLGALVWAAGLVAVHQGIGELASGTVALDEARGAAAGAAIGAFVAVAGVWSGLRPRPGQDQTLP